MRGMIAKGIVWVLKWAIAHPKVVEAGLDLAVKKAMK